MKFDEYDWRELADLVEFYKLIMLLHFHIVLDDERRDYYNNLKERCLSAAEFCEGGNFIEVKK